MATVSVLDVICGEKAGFVDVVIRLDAPADGPIQVNFTTDEGSAGTRDYAGKSGTIGFDKGELQKTIRIPITTDATAEPFESFYVSLFGARGATLGKSEAVVTIVDNDAPRGTPTTHMRDVFVDERAGTATFAVTLDRPSGRPVTMDYALSAGTASAGLDFVDSAGSLRFGAGETVKLVTVRIKDDARIEQAESFDLVLSNVVNANAPDARATAFIGASDMTATDRPNISINDGWSASMTASPSLRSASAPQAVATSRSTGRPARAMRIRGIISVAAAA